MRTRMMFTQFGIGLNDTGGGQEMVKQLQKLADDNWQIHSWHVTPMVLPSKLQGVAEYMFVYHYIFTKLELPIGGASGAANSSPLPKVS